ncbi:GAF domain-containing protein [Planktothrix sp. PCC 11201]|uniref:GAF domain-containing protein n=1 Tax=Planktothrix sp. PCC 11201 TaxID=1729650 RepID=UPI00118055C8|nr:GAF domain-containing protein [Planktothrix sp. PCC 11201]
MSKNTVPPESTEQFTSCQKLETPEDWKQTVEQLFYLQHSSHLLMAIIDPQTLTVHYANQSFCHVCQLNPALLGAETGLSVNPQRSYKNIEVADRPLNGLNLKIQDLFPHWDHLTLEKLYRYHLLHKILKQDYGIDLQSLQLLDQSVIAILNCPETLKQKFIRIWLNSDLLQIKRRDPKQDEFAHFKLKLIPVSEREAWFSHPENFNQLAQQLTLDHYQIEGVLLLEGLEITRPEKMRRITYQLISRDLTTQSDYWEQIERQLNSLFSVNNCLLLRIQGQEAKLSLSLNNCTTAPIIYSLDTLNDSPIIQAVQQNQVLNIPDLRQQCPTDFERHLRKLHVRSLLLIPLVIQSVNLKGSQQILGVVGLTSDRPNHFTLNDVKNAQELIPAFITAFCHSLQQQFTKLRNIHPSVEWRFLQEAERRSWGFKPETIVFETVYPLYGISDIRSSSEQRNCAIKEDLLEQFQLAINIVEVLCETQDSALGEQLKQDLQNYLTQLHAEINVEIEMSATDYLEKHLEIYFDYFSQCNTQVQKALKQYEQACDNEHGCIYKARSKYDEMLHQITDNLQQTWTNWQKQMQTIIPHYYDMEISDGMDHIIYAGKSIDSRFTSFHIRSLRYEQLRAMCDCARSLFKLKSEHKITLDLVHLVLVQHTPIDIFHDENTEGIFSVRGTRDIRYEIVKKRIDKGIDKETKTRITQSGMITIVYSTEEEREEYEQYLRYLHREGWVTDKIEFGVVDPLPGVSGLNYARVAVIGNG